MQKSLLTKFNTIYDKKTLQTVSIEGTYLYKIKVIHEKPTANIVLNGENLKPFPLRSGTRQGCPCSTLLFHIDMEVFTTEIRDEKEIKESKSEKKK